MFLLTWQIYEQLSSGKENDKVVVF